MPDVNKANEIPSKSNLFLINALQAKKQSNNPDKQIFCSRRIRVKIYQCSGINIKSQSHYQNE